MKRQLTVLLLTLAALSLFWGCKKSGGTGTAGVSRTIGIIQLADNGAFTDMREGFLDRLGELGYGEAELKVDYKNAQGDIGTLNTICQEMAVSNYDLVVTIATPAAQAFVNQESKVPLIFISVTDPV
ncbi:MAG: ABC transporter substrate-binding protein, partial [Spirochaetaceae bacterium]|nr:ABC transporter substrate-binding protein [Spirochaetaceae bacterium]